MIAMITITATSSTRVKPRRRVPAAGHARAPDRLARWFMAATGKKESVSEIKDAYEQAAGPKKHPSVPYP
jgi:hypothetical protein